MQSALQPSPSTLLPSSQTSPGSLVPLPHTSPDLQSALQPSSSAMLPSSQSSSASSTPLPQRSLMQTSCAAAHVMPVGHTLPDGHSFRSEVAQPSASTPAPKSNKATGAQEPTRSHAQRRPRIVINLTLYSKFCKRSVLKALRTR